MNRRWGPSGIPLARFVLRRVDPQSQGEPEALLVGLAALGMLMQRAPDEVGAAGRAAGPVATVREAAGGSAILGFDIQSA